MNFKETKPIYMQIADRLCDEILQGTYGSDERIPSVREYAAIVEVNANTVVRSFDHLQNSGIIYNRRGLGYFVSVEAVERIKALRRHIFLSEELPTLFAGMDTLGITIEDIVRLYNEHHSAGTSG